MGDMVMLNGFVIEDDVLVRYLGKEEHVVIPDGITQIGKHAFRKNHRIKSVYIPEGVISIGNSAFYDCYNLESVSVPDGMTKFGVWVFARCFRLEKIDLPDSITFIGKGAFDKQDIFQGTTVHASSGSYAEAFANENGITFVAK